MPDVEGIAVGAVKDLFLYCPRLATSFTENDKTPVTDGFIDLYEGPGRSKSDLIGRVAVQIKGRSTSKKRNVDRVSVKFPVDRADLRFFRDNGGGIFFYVAIHQATRRKTVFYTTLTPFKLDRIIRSMKAAQETIGIGFTALSNEIARLEGIVEFAWHTSKQNVTQGISDRLFDGGSTLTIYSAEGLDLSRPATLDLMKKDFAVTLHTQDGMSIPVDMDITFYPPNYVQHEEDLSVHCGDIWYPKCLVRQVADEQLEIRPSPELRILLSPKNIHISFEAGDGTSLPSQLRSLDFFIAASEGFPVTVGDHLFPSETELPGASRGMVIRRTQAKELIDLLAHLGVEQSVIDITRVEEQQFRMLSLMHKALVLGEQLHAESGAAGRFDASIGNMEITVMAVPGDEEGYWKFFDIFEPANRTLFRLLATDEAGEFVEIAGTAYEGLTSDDLGSILNLRLDTIVQAYDALEDTTAAFSRANQKILQMIYAADKVEGFQRDALITAAVALNEWLINRQGADPVHLINRWQLAHRRGDLSVIDRDEVRSLRRTIAKSEPLNADLIDACCAILLGDPEDIQQSVDRLSEAEASDLRGWPVWQLTQSAGGSR